MLQISSAERYLQCPGSYVRGKAAEEAGTIRESTPEAERGKRIHALVSRLLRHESVDGAEEEEVNAAKRIVKSVLDLESRHVRTGDSLEEEEFFIYNRSGEAIWHGHPDRVTPCEDVIILHEYKTGYLPVHHAERNLQARFYAVCVYRALNKHQREQRPVLVHMVTPYHSSPATYNADAIRRAENEARRLYQLVMRPDAPVVADALAQCRYCPAAGTKFCPASLDVIEQTQLVLARSEVPVAELSKYYKIWMQVKVQGKKLVDQIHDYFRRNVVIPGLAQGKPIAVNEITSVETAYKIAKRLYNVDKAEFLNICKVGLTDLVNLAAYTAKRKKVQVKSELLAALADAGALRINYRTPKIIVTDEAK